MQKHFPALNKLCNMQYAEKLLLRYRWKKRRKNWLQESPDTVSSTTNLFPTVLQTGTVPSSVADPLHFGADPDPTPFFSEIKDAKNCFSYFFLITYPQAHYLQSLIYCFRKKFCVKILFCKQYFSPLNTFMRKGKDPDPDPDPYRTSD